MMHFSSVMVDLAAEVTIYHRSHAKGHDTLVPSAASITPRRRTCRATSRHIEAPTRSWPRSARPATRSTSRCRRSPCTSSPTTWRTSATSAAKASRGRGCCKATCGHTRETSHTVVHTVVRLLRIDPICELICKHTLPSSIFAVRDATNHSRSSLTLTNITNPPALRTHRCPAPLPRHPSHLPHPM